MSWEEPTYILYYDQTQADYSTFDRKITLTRVTMPPATMFATRFYLNGSSRYPKIMATGISIKTAEAIRAD